MTLQEAITVLVKDEAIGDFVYNIREKACSDGSFAGNSWEHPRVIRFSEAVTRLEAELKEVA